MGDIAKIDSGNERKGYRRGEGKEKRARDEDEDKMVVVDLGREVSEMSTRVELGLYAL